MSDIKITTVPYGQCISGNDSVEPRLEITWFKNNFGGVVPNTVYCPACSTLTEYNDKWGEVQEKRTPTEKDYCFEIGYDQDGDELHARCLKCNFDLRQEAPTLEMKPKPKTQRKEGRQRSRRRGRSRRSRRS